MFHGGSDGKASAYNARDPGSIPESGRSPGKGNGNPLQYSYLENPMDRGACRATVHGVTKSWTWLSPYWSWSSNTLATWCEELTHWKRPWCWERLWVGGEGDDRGRDGWMASLTRWKWVWVNSRSWWWTGRPGVLQFMGSQRAGHDWATELNWECALYIWPSWLSGKESPCNAGDLQEIWVQSLGQEDPLEKGMTTHSNILAWEIPRTEKPVRL